MNRASLMYGWWQQIRQFPWLSVGWLTIGTGVLVACFLLWLSVQLAERLTVEVAEPTATPEIAVVLPDRLEGEIGMLVDAVPPLDLNKQVVAVGQRAPEFRGTEFIKANSSNWTLQVMKVSQESVVKTYLSQRKDRQRFQYFRVVEGTQEHYLLTYGNFTTVQTAMGALQSMQFDLPNSVKAFPERFSTYQALVKDQGAEERMSGLSQKVRQILLKPVAVPIDVDVVERATRTSRASVQEPAFGALAGDQVAAKIDPALSLPPNSPSSGAGSSSVGSNGNTVSSSPAPVVSSTPVQDPFN